MVPTLPLLSNVWGWCLQKKMFVFVLVMLFVGCHCDNAMDHPTFSFVTKSDITLNGRKFRFPSGTIIHKVIHGVSIQNNNFEDSSLRIVEIGKHRLHMSLDGVGLTNDGMVKFKPAGNKKLCLSEVEYWFLLCLPSKAGAIRTANLGGYEIGCNDNDDRSLIVPTDQTIVWEIEIPCAPRSFWFIDREYVITGSPVCAVRTHADGNRCFIVRTEEGKGESCVQELTDRQTFLITGAVKFLHNNTESGNFMVFSGKYSAEEIPYDPLYWIGPMYGEPLHMVLYLNTTRKPHLASQFHRV